MAVASVTPSELELGFGLLNPDILRNVVNFIDNESTYISAMCVNQHWNYFLTILVSKVMRSLCLRQQWFKKVDFLFSLSI